MADYAQNSFKYGRNKYYFNAALYDNINEKNIILLNNEYIHSFEYINELNSLYITGQIVYTDRYGLLSNLLNKMYCYCVISMQQMEEKYDNDISIDIVGKNSFKHKFIVNNIQILEKDINNYVTYAIDLVSLNWRNCVCNIKYSNYGESQESSLELLKKFISQVGLKTGNTFESVTSPSKFNYITQNNDNLQNIFKYLLNKMFFTSEDADKSFKFLRYDEVKDTYELFDVADQTTYCAHDTIVVSLFQSTFEGMSTRKPYNFSTVTRVPKIDFYDSLKLREVYTYEYDTNSFANFENTSENIVNLFNKKIEKFSRKNKIDLQMSDGLMIRGDTVHSEGVWNNDPSKLKFNDSESQWDSQRNIYFDQINNLLDNDALIIEGDGILNRYPGMVLNVIIDRELEDLQSESRTEYEDLINRFRQYGGDWFVSKVRHHIVPDPSNRETEYRQNICLFRNYVLKPK